MNKYHEKNILAYDKKACGYDKTFDGKFTAKFKMLLIDSVLINAMFAGASPVSVLDVGCGNGAFLSKLSERKGVSGFGVDLSPQMIANAKALYPSFVFEVSGCEAIPFDDNSMDIITVCAAYHHFPNVDAFAAEASRLLRTDGSLYVADICLPAPIRAFVNLLMPLSKDGDVRVYSKKEIASTFEAFGFRLVNATTQGYVQILHFQKI